MHLLVDISAHGYGHLAQTAPVLAALRTRRPDLRLTVRSALPTSQLDSRIAPPFEHIATASDFGFVMRNAVDIDLVASRLRYEAAHRDWAQRVAAEAEWQNSLEIDGVLSNASYLPLAGASRAGIPAAGLSSLNWAALFAHYFAEHAWASPILTQMQAAYGAAQAFLRVSPGLPMADLPNRREIGPIAALGPADRAAVAARYALPEPARWILLAMGGMDFPLPVARWPRLPGVVWLAPAAWGVAREDVRSTAVTGADFTDLLSTVDAVVTKPGYGTFAEAACHGVPLLYLERPDWPETPHLADWLNTHGRCAEISRAALLAGDLKPALDALWARPTPPRPCPSGADEAADWLLNAMLSNKTG